MFGCMCLCSCVPGHVRLSEDGLNGAAVRGTAMIMLLGVWLPLCVEPP